MPRKLKNPMGVKSWLSGKGKKPPSTKERIQRIVRNLGLDVKEKRQAYDLFAPPRTRRRKSKP